MTAIPTRWRTTLEEQLADARARLEAAEGHLGAEDGGRALQSAYPAVVASATVRLWLEFPPWQRPLAPDEMQRRVREAFPSRFAALAVLDLRDVLTSPWTTQAAAPYVAEAKEFFTSTERYFESWLAQA